MKRYIALILALGLLALCACGAAGTAAPAEAGEALPEETRPVDLLRDPAAAETPAPEALPEAAEAPAPVEAPELAALLQEVRERARPGTAGASLTAMELGAKLLDWSSAAEADEAQVRAAVEAFLAPLGEPERAEFALQMSGVSGAVTRLQTEDAAAMMEDIGGTEGTLFPWPDARTELLEALFDAAGANGEIIDPNE